MSPALEGLLEPRDRAKQLKSGGMRCYCDLDNWEPSRIRALLAKEA